MADDFVPYIPPERSLPEITFKGLLLGIVLAVILGAANTYLGLLVGLTVSASIPAAVVSMAVLRAFKKNNILENNAVQTAASAGESLAAGVLFTIPALLILDYWSEVHYIETTLVALTGGILGVLFTVPLRKALIVEAKLTFPEGVATSEVLRTGHEAGHGIAALAWGAIVGLAYKFMASGMQMWAHGAEWATRFRDRGVVAFGSDLSPALLGVGYIVGVRIGILVFAGGALGWLVAIPLFSLLADSTVVTLGADSYDFATGTAADAAAQLWSLRIRYIGVGAMLIGGIWSLVKLRRPLMQALGAGLGARRERHDDAEVIRTEREFGMGATFLGVVGMVVPIVALYWFATKSLAIAAAMGLIMVVTGFLFSAVGAYMAGIVGSSNNPISGVTILTVLAAAFSLKFLGVDSTLGPAATILVAAVIASAGAIASDNVQDLKAGYLLGATPKRQQTMQVIGVTAAALAVAPVLNLLHGAYTIGSEALPAPQAGLMAAVGRGVFEGGLPATMVAWGAGIAVVLILLDEWLERRGSSFRTPPMPVAVGIYLPVGLTFPIFLGGLLAWGLDRRYRRGQDSAPAGVTSKWRAWRKHGNRNGILFSSGLIAGEALVGIAVAALLTIYTTPPTFVSDGSLQWPGVVLFLYMVALLAYFVLRPGMQKE